MQNPGRFWIQRQSTVGNPADTSAGGIYARLRPESGGAPYAAFEGQRGRANGNPGGLAALAGGFYGGYFKSLTQPGNVGVYAWCDAANGSGVYGVGNTATSFGIFAYGNVAGATGVVAGGNAAGATYIAGSGVSGSSSNVGVFGYSATAGAQGVQGRSPGTSGVGIASAVYGWATNASGVGVHGVGNNLGAGWVPDAGAGVVGNGNTIGMIGFATAATSSFGVAGVAPGTAGTWSVGTKAMGVQGSTTDGIGVAGFVATGVDRLAVLGVNGGTVSTLSNGYVAIEGTADGNATGSYGVWGYAATAAAGRVGVEGSAGTDPYYSSTYWIGVLGAASAGGIGVVAVGGYGGKGKGDIAGYFLGDVKIAGQEGFKGSPQAGGNLYVSGVVASIAEVGPDTYVPMFGMTSTSGVKVYFDGQGRLKNGEAFIPIPEDMRKVIAANAQVVVTPVGSWSGIYVAEIRSDGFLVKSGAGDPNAEFKWIAVAERKGYEGEKAQNFLAGLDLKPLEIKVSEAVTVTATRTESSTRSADAPELRTIKATEQTPADPKKEVK